MVILLDVDKILVLVVEAHGRTESVLAKRVDQFARAHDLDDGGLAFVHLPIDGLRQGWSDVLELVDVDVLGAYGADACPPRSPPP